MQCFYAEYEKEIKANCSESILFFILNLINKRKKRKDGFQIMQCCLEQKPPPCNSKHYRSTLQYKGASGSQLSLAVSYLVGTQIKDFGAIWRNECAKKTRQFCFISFGYELIFFLFN